MEIKKGISQMAEYLNVEINYVMPKDGRMYYVLKDGILANGCIIATLDPKYAIDEKNLSTSVGVFSEAGEVLIDFDKKSIKSISDDLVLVESSKLSTPEVIGISGKETDPMVSQAVSEAKENIIMRMQSQMSPTGEILFSDPYKEANVYRLDSYNHKLGIDCSFIGKDETGLFFHTNDIGGQIQIVELDDFKVAENVIVENLEEESEPEGLSLNIDNELLSGFNIPDEDLEKMKSQNEEQETAEPSKVEPPKSQEIIEETEEPKPVSKENLEQSQSVVADTEEEPDDDEASDEISLNIINNTEDIEEEEYEEEEMEKSRYKEKNRKVRNRKRDIDFDIEEDEDNYEEEIEDEELEESEKPKGKNRKSKSKDVEKEEVLDHAIEVINKMIKETNKLKRRIALLEEKLQEKEEIIQESESKKDELNDILDKANEVLQRIS
ncbi:MAG: hypothetical protein HFJ12_01175 [Bacilli bacterium]|nr:hypothetical protein [Bacilli bacterium]